MCLKQCDTGDSHVESAGRQNVASSITTTPPPQPLPNIASPQSSVASRSGIAKYPGQSAGPPSRQQDSSISPRSFGGGTRGTDNPPQGRSPTASGNKRSPQATPVQQGLNDVSRGPIRQNGGAGVDSADTQPGQLGGQEVIIHATVLSNARNCPKMSRARHPEVACIASVIQLQAHLYSAEV